MSQTALVPRRVRTSARSIISALLAALIFMTQPAIAQQATVDTQVGDTVTNPATGETAEVVALIENYAVLTDNDDVIIVHVAVGDTFTPPGGTTPVLVDSVTTNATTGLIDTITIDPNDPDNPPDPPDALVTMDVARSVDQDVADAIAAAAGDPSDPENDIIATVPTGSVNTIDLRRVGANGANGNHGYGVRICDPFGVLGCATIGYAGTNGGSGRVPTAVDLTVYGPDIQAVNGTDGIRVVSQGGNGGNGGNGYGINIPGRRGGNAGSGGTVTVTSNVNIATSGTSGHGMFGQSRAGRPGAGGTGYIASGGGSGGGAGQGGNVTLRNNGTISTIGNDSMGMFAQSMGGSAGAGGDSWGFVGSGGSSTVAGNGGTTNTINNGDIVTEGHNSHGMFSQSVGGTGGFGGDAAGLITGLGGGGSVGGNGGSVFASNLADARIQTSGNSSYGIFALSTGGGGGDGGFGAAIVGIGGTGSAGGSGGGINVNNLAGSSIVTSGQSAHGVFAQSIGGGGGTGATGGGVVAIGGAGSAAGNGGNINVFSEADITTSGDNSRALYAQSAGGGGGSANGSGGLVALGGRGGSAGNGGTINMTNNGTLITQGEGSDGVFAQSIGKGGGSGAATGGVVSIGGSGSGGGTGDTVTVTNNGTIATGGNSARGIYATSTGGGGGFGGDNGGLITIGGSAAIASNGGAVNVTNNGGIATAGNNSTAIHAQSIGGGGGAGGTTGGVFLTVGGGGGGGGNGSTVTVASNRNLTTEGDNSYGILAQSVGGGGGWAGSGYSGSLFAGVAIGGVGGAGGRGGNVTVRTYEYEIDLGDGPLTLMPLIQTSGRGSAGILAQSTGGGGGAGGNAVQGTAGTYLSASVAIGGSSNSGGNGGSVTIDSSAAVSTEGFNADGVIAQSTGGGGGNGGYSVSGSLQVSSSAGVGVGVGVGGRGSSGGHGGTVNADFSGSIQTTGEQSQGFIAQSTGGGGGNGGFNVTGTIGLGTIVGGAVAVGVGGSGDAGGNGGSVTATSNATIMTEGELSDGVLIQSVGGGGGNGGFNIPVAIGVGDFYGGAAASVGVGGSGTSGGMGGVVNGTVNGVVQTEGRASDAIVVQSVGGGGGNAGFSVGVSAGAGPALGGGIVVGLGGSSAEGGRGSAVTADINSDVTTSGDYAQGAIIQSIGGGGGNANFNVTADIVGGGVGSLSANVGIGGSGGRGGSGNVVDATLVGNFLTTGEFSSAIMAQSIGGGGGNAGANIGGTLGINGIGANIGLGGAAGDSGNGGAVTVDHNGDIWTEGEQSDGIFAQSVGGGGGNVDWNMVTGLSTVGQIDVGVGRVGGTGGTGGTVEVTTNGTITTNGDEAVGVRAQSVGNGGGKSGGVSASVSGSGPAAYVLGVSVGLEGGQGGTGGAVTITTDGRVQTAGRDSHAIQAQSIGGGGGIGGMGFRPVLGSGSLGVSVGGAGGTGGTSGLITVDNSAELLTLGDRARGIYAQSIGGGGGNGGIAATAGIQTLPFAANVNVGGVGGTGMSSGAVTVSNDSVIETRGDDAAGIYAQTVGGGGGNGGMSINAIATIGQVPGTNIALGIAVGGEGGSGALGGDATVTNNGIVATFGDDSSGIFAQSLGGGGGNAGLTGNLQLDIGAGGGQIGVTVGGIGGSGGAGGTVSVTNAPVEGDDMTGIIVTQGDNSHGIHTQSIGGGGGNGSSVVAINGTNGTGSLQIGVAVGGEGGIGGVGGTLDVSNSGFIVTSGDNSHGVYAQSVGGGGGNAGVAIAANVILSSGLGTSFAPLFAIGSDGGAGGNGGNVTVTNSGDIDTDGAGSKGIVAQSIGGGGGDGALALSLTSSTSALTQLLNFAGPIYTSLGATAGQGGIGGNVTVNHSGYIRTLEEGAEAIIAQSINGGGGTMRLDFSGISNIGSQLAGSTDPLANWRCCPTDTGVDPGDPVWNFHVGAFDTQNSNAGNVTINTTGGTFDMQGSDSIGEFLQAIGGGGGVLKFRVQLDEDGDGALPLVTRVGGLMGSQNNGGNIDSSRAGDTISVESGAHGTLLQSIGGGGGRAVTSVDLGAGRIANLFFVLGGEGGTNESGGSVAYDRTGNVLTMGSHALGTAIQSIGGGGGSIMGRASGTAAESASVILGARSGTVLDGGSLDLTLAGDLQTLGRQGHGLFLQSIGAGGGLMQFNGATNVVDVALGSFGGASGNGGDLAASNAGGIWTEGEMAHAVFLQSIGGGGGAVFTDANASPLAVDLNAAGIGDGGSISFTQTGDISTTGSGSFGVFAQSLGGGGGVVNNLFSGSAGGSGSGGAIDLQFNGSVMAMADGATAVFAQSEGSDGAGDITISLSSDNSIVAGAGGTAVMISGGNNNVIINDGMIGTVDGLDGRAVSASSGNETIVSNGTILGSVALGGGDNFLTNEEGALLFSGNSIELDIERTGAATVGTLFNFGTMVPGGMDRAIETLVDGNFAQSATGLLMSDLDLSRTSDGGQADSLTVSGTALMDGTIDLRMANPGFVLPGEHRDIIISATGGYGTFTGGLGETPNISLTGIPVSAVANFSFEYLNGTDIVLNSNINFAPQGVNQNQSALGNHVNGIQLAGGSNEFAPMATSLFFTPTLGELKDIYDMLSPEPYADAMSRALMSSTQFGEMMMGCRNRRGDASTLDDGQCRWMRLSHRFLKRDQTTENFGAEQEAIELSFGAQLEIDGARHVGYGLSYARGESTSGLLSSGDFDIWQVGGVYRQPLGKFGLAVTLTGGQGSFDTVRAVSLPTISIAESSPDIAFATLHGRLSRDIVRDRWYVRPMIDIGVNYMRLKSFSEQGAGAANLVMPSLNDTFLSVHPSLEVGGEMMSGRSVSVRPYGRIGMLFANGGSTPEVDAMFDGAPDGVAPFTVGSGMDDTYGDFALGIDLEGSGASMFRIEAIGLLGENTHSMGVDVSWLYRFK